jgi:cytochrome P450
MRFYSVGVTRFFQTVSAISTCCLALALFPNVQDRVHEELDRVIGRNRLPTESDRGRLPYLDAVITEGLRWRPVAPLGIYSLKMQCNISDIPGRPAASTVSRGRI